MKKLAYVIVRENLDSPLIRSQVVDVLCSVSDKCENDITLLWFYRIDYLAGSSKKIAELRRELSHKHIKLVAIPFIAGRFPVSWWQTPIIVPQWLLGFAFAYFFLRIRIFHCRSYHAVLAALVFGFTRKIKFIFDPRSPFPEEKLAAGIWRVGSYDYKFWKYIEKEAVNSSFVTLAISRAFATDLKKHVLTSKIKIIPNNYPTEFYNKNAENPAVNNISEDEIRLCYVGSLGHWNDADMYIRFFENFIEKSKRPVFISFIVPLSSINSLREALALSRIPLNIVSVKTVEQDCVYNAIKNATLGVYLMKGMDSRLGVKTVEYLAAGLPVIVSDTILGAADVVNDFGVGVVIGSDLNDLKKAVDFAEKIMENREGWREKCIDLAKKNFSPDIIATSLLDLYRAASD